MFYLHVYIITIFHNYAFNNPFHLISSYISKHFNDFFETSFLKTCGDLLPSLSKALMVPTG